VNTQVTAHHEAGHAVAVLMRNGGQLHYVDINASDEWLGYTHYASKPPDRAFITFAGPWAEARTQWPLTDLDGVDGNGSTFDDYVGAAFLANIDGDAELYRDLYNAEHPELRRFRPRLEQFWSRTELEKVWPVIQKVAQLLLSEGADMYYAPDHQTWHDTIEQLLAARGA
jgi:hypothetical protein